MQENFNTEDPLGILSSKDPLGILKKKDGGVPAVSGPSASVLQRLDELKKQLKENQLAPQRTELPKQVKQAKEKAEFVQSQEQKTPKVAQMMVYSKPTFKVEYPEQEELTAKVLGFQNAQQKIQFDQEGKEKQQQKAQQAADEFYNTSTGKLYYNFLKPIADAGARAIGNTGATVSRLAGEDELADELVKRFTPEKRYEGTIAGTKPTKLQGGLFNDGKMDLAKLPSTIVRGLTDMAWLIAPAGMAGRAGQAAGLTERVAQGAGLVGTSFVQTREDYYQEGKAAGLKGEALDNFATGAAGLTSALEAVFPNTLALGGFKTKLAKDYAKQIANGITTKAALKAGAKEILKEAAVKEPAQEMTQLGGDKVARTIVDMSTGENNFGDQFDWEKSRDEIYETLVITPIISTIAAGSGALRNYTPTNYEKAIFYDASKNADKVNQYLDNAYIQNEISEDQYKEAKQKFSNYNNAVSQIKNLGYSEDQTLQMAWELFSGKEKMPATQSVISDPILKDALGDEIKKDKEALSENIRLIGMGVPSVGAEIDGKEVSYVISNIGDKGTEIGQGLVDQIGEDKYRVEEVNVTDLYNTDQEFKQYVDSYKKGSISADAMLVPAVIKDGKIVDGRARLAESYLSGKNNIKVFKNISDAINQSKVQEGRTEGDLGQPQGIVQGQPEVGQGEGSQGQAEVTTANVGDSNIGSEGQVVAPELSNIESVTPEQKKEVIRQKFDFITNQDFVQESFTQEEDIADRSTLPDSGFANEQEFKNFLETGEYAMLTGQNPEAIPVSKEANKKLNDRAREWLSDRGLRAIPIFGKYGNSERSFMVPDMTKSQAIEFAKDFSQDSVAHSTGLVFKDGSFNPRQDGVVIDSLFDKGEDNFSSINISGSPVDFKIRFDFDTTIPSDAAEKSTMVEELLNDVFNTPIEKARQSLSPTGVDIQVVSNPTEYDSQVEKLGGQRGTEGVFLSNEGKILLNEQKLKEGVFAGRIIWHEASHPVMNIVRNTNPDLYNRVLSGLKQVDNPAVKQAIKWANENYEGQGTIDDESIVETVAMVADGTLDLDAVPAGLKQSIIDFINLLARALGFNQVLNDTDVAAFKKLAGQIADALTSGRDIAQVVGRENVKKYKNTSNQYSSGNRFDYLNDAKSEVHKINPNNIYNVIKFANESSLPNNLEFKRELQDRFQAYIKEIKKAYGKTFEPLAYNDAVKSFYIDALREEARKAISDHPEAIGWYDQKTKNSLAIISLIHPEIATDRTARAAFILPLAITSNGNLVDKNFEYALDQYENYKDNNRYDSSKEFGKQQSGIKSSLDLMNMILDAGVTMDQLTDYFTSKQRAGNLKFTIKVNGKPKSIDLSGNELVDEEVYAASILGPKIGNGFYMNLWGEFEQLTMDRWFMRTWGRLGGTLVDVDKGLVSAGKERVKNAIAEIKKDPDAKAVLKSVVGSTSNMSVSDVASVIGKESSDPAKRAKLTNNPLTNELRKASNSLVGNMAGEVEAPRQGTERKFIREVFRDVQKSLKLDGIDITMADLQAVLWYPEKILYDSFQKGKTFEQISKLYEEGSAPDYQNAAAGLARKRGFTDEQINDAIRGGLSSGQLNEGGAGTISDSDRQSNKEKIFQVVREAKSKEKPESQASVGNRGDLTGNLNKKLTDDGQGNYVFFHYSGKKLNKIDPSKFGANLATGRDERPGVGISMYYVDNKTLETGVPSDFGYAVRIPKDKVYPFNEDPLNFYDQAKVEFEKDYPGQAFDANKQIGYITKVANDNGFDITVADWNIKGRKALRAQTTKSLKPEVYKQKVFKNGSEREQFNEELQKLKPGVQASVGGRNFLRTGPQAMANTVLVGGEDISFVLDYVSTPSNFLSSVQPTNKSNQFFNFNKDVRKPVATQLENDLDFWKEELASKTPLNNQGDISQVKTNLINKLQDRVDALQTALDIWNNNAFSIADISVNKKAQASVGNRSENNPNFKLGAFVMRKKAEGATDGEIAIAIASVTGMKPEDIKTLIDNPEQYIRDMFPSMTKLQQDNLIHKAKIQNIYRGRQFGKPIDKAFTGLEVPQEYIDEYMQKTAKSDNAVKEWATEFKRKWLDPAKGLPDWVLAIKDFASGSKNIEIARAAKTIERLKDEAKKIGFSDWDAFGKALVVAKDVKRYIPNEDGVVPFDTYRAAAGKMFTTPDDQLPALVPDEIKALPDEIIPYVYAMRGQIDNLTRDLIGFGYVTPEQAVNLEKNIGSYVNRSYRMFNEMGYKPEPEVKNAAIKFLADDYVKEIATDKAGTIAYKQAYDEAIDKAKKDVDAILNKKKNPFFNASTDRRNTGILQERQDIPEPLRKVMGEYTDPGTVFMMTVAKQAALKASSQYLNKLRENGMGTLFFEKDDPSRLLSHSVQIASLGSESMSPLGGLYTTPEIAEAIEMAEPTYNNFTQVWMKLVGAVRWGKTVGSVATQFKNFESNLGFAVLNGYLMSGQNTAAFKASAKYVKGQYSKAEIDTITDKAIRLGLVGQSVGARELKEMLGSGDVHDIALDIALGTDGKWGKKVAKKLNVFKEANKLYRLGDDFWKVYAYMTEREQLADARFGSKYDELTKEQQEQIDVESSERVKNTWPTYDRVVELAKVVSKNAPIFGNFISFQAESLRVLANSIKLAKQDMADPQLRHLGVRRAVGIAAYFGLRSAITIGLAKMAGFAAAGVLGAAFGDDEEERNKRAIKQALPPFMRTSDLAVIKTNEPHKFTVISLSSLDPYAIIPNSLNAYTEGREGIFGKTMDPGVGAATAELLSAFLEPEMTFNTMWSTLNNIDPKTKEQIVLGNDTNAQAAVKVGGKVWDMLEPSSVALVQRFFERKDKEAEILAIGGARPYDVDLHKSFGYILSQFGKDVDAINREYNSLKYRDIPQNEKNAAEMAAEDKKAFAISKLNETYRDFINLGADPKVLNDLINQRSSIKMTGFDKNTKKFIKTGNINKKTLFK